MPTSPNASSEAAVALVLSGDDLLFIRRADNPRDPWSGHMALPGGRIAPGDPSPQSTARRETREEVGVELPENSFRFSLEPVGTMSRVRGVSLIVEAYVFELPTRPTTEPNHEVAEVLWIPTEALRSGRLETTFSFRAEDAGGVIFTRDFPAWSYEGRTIWGLTYAVVRQFLNSM